MFSLSSSAILALAALSCVSAHSFSHFRRHSAPAGWATNYLEEYKVYHGRYLAIDCENKHDTTFFKECCHPLLKTETLAANRPKWCVPGHSSAAAVHTPSPTAVVNVVASSSTAHVAHVAPTQAADDDEDCDDDEDNADDDDEEDCDDEEDNADDDDEEDCDDEDEDDNNGEDDDEEDCDDDDDESSTHTPAVSATHPPQVTHATPTTHATPSTTLKMTTVKVTTPKPTISKAPTTTYKATTAKATTTAATGDKSSGNFITGGFSTWFTQNGVAGACGKVHKDTEFVAALQTQKYDHGSNCGRKIRVTNLSNGKTVDAIVADECPTCTNTACVDLSVAAFKQLADLSVGEFAIKYEYLD
ncbi:RlpA-like double-psi beta-barrel-protein domain-containing protein-containing protein [Mycena rebaudengoi]|nr:RlpA-like double-psi beta-barrel-protein domain-containing protein-containing protein [Mycena rebaudengoi]